jgi:hypothetical protein
VPAVPDEAVERGGLDRTLPPGGRVFAGEHLTPGRVREPYPLTVPGRRALGINQVSKTIKPNGPAVEHPYQPASKAAEERVPGDLRLEVAGRPPALHDHCFLQPRRRVRDQRLGLARRTACQAQNMQYLAELIQHGLGISILPPASVRAVTGPAQALLDLLTAALSSR